MGWLSRLSDLFVKGLSENDHALVANYLDEPGRFLFYQMDLVDQQHTLKVARYLLREVAFRRGVDTERLIQAALLHDSGKVRGDMKKMPPGYCWFFAPVCPGNPQKALPSGPQPAFALCLLCRSRSSETRRLHGVVIRN